MSAFVPRRSMIGEPLDIIGALRRTTPPPTIVVVDFRYPNATRTTTPPDDLERLAHGLEDHHLLEKLSLFHVDIRDGQNKSAVSPEFRRLLADVIPRHPTLTALAIVCCCAPPGGLGSTLFSSLAEGSPHSKAPSSQPPPPPILALKKVELVHTPLDASDIEVIGQMLASGGAARIEELQIRECGLKSEQCRIICQGAGRSPYLRKLVVSVSEIEGDAVSPALVGGGSGGGGEEEEEDDPESAQCVLAHLEVTASVWTEDGLESVAAALRRNRTVQRIALCSTDVAFPDAGVNAILRTLQSSNYALLKLTLECRGREHPRSKDLRRLLRRNAGAAAFHVEEFGRSLLPHAVHAVGHFPELLHHMMRSNVGALAEMMQGRTKEEPTKEEEEPAE
jgi:hypothetical protein